MSLDTRDDAVVIVQASRCEAWKGHALLLDALVQLCRDCDAAQLWLEVRQSNARALQVYERYGFVRVGLRKDYYPADRQQREHAVVMSLKL